MPIDVSIRFEDGLVQSDWVGALDNDGLLGGIVSIEAFEQANNCGIGRRVHDVRAVSEVNVNFNALMHVSHVRRDVVQAQGAFRTAFIVATSDQYGVIRIYQSLMAASGAQVGIFDDPAAARAWAAGDEPAPESDLGLGE